MNYQKFLSLILILAGISFLSAQTQYYKPDFSSLEKIDPVPEWFKDAKFGIYFHWGVYSVPAFGNEWYPRNMYMKGTTENLHHIESYGDPAEWPYNNFITGAKDKNGNFIQFAPKLKSEGGKFDPQEWAQLFFDSGAKFAGPVAEHHDGFSMWESEVNPWNAKDMGPKLDLVKILTDEIRKKNMKIILSMHHAYNITGFYEAAPKTNDPKLRILFGQQGKEKNEELWLAKHKEIIDKYQPDIIWQDFNLHLLSRPVLLGFLSYYYNQAIEWNKKVVATFKDGLNTKCAVLDYERGGPVDITDNYWLTDDAISSSSWCYTEGIGYYSKIQIMHGFLDRISKNGNLLLNISPLADGTIPQEQKDILLAMGDWLKKYGEAVYSTRAWEKYGEGPTKMGAEHGIFMEPEEGTSRDIRFTRSKDNKTLYAILLGWEEGQESLVINSLSSERINCKNLNSVELINGEAGNYLKLNYKQDETGLTVNLPEKQLNELAYVIKLNFENEIPKLDMFANIDNTPYYYITPENNNRGLVLGHDLVLKNDRKNPANQWKFESEGKGIYKISNRADNSKVIEYNSSDMALKLSTYSGDNNQLWKIDDAHSGLFTIANKQYPDLQLSINKENDAHLQNSSQELPAKWTILEVCEMQKKAFKPNYIPGIVEAEDYNSGCPEEVYYDRDEFNSGREYRPDEAVDIEKCSAGGYNVGWTSKGEWMEYNVNVDESGNYEIEFYVASPSENSKIILEIDGVDQTGIVEIPNTAGYQNWTVVKRKIKIEAGKHTMRLIIDEGGLNIDKMEFKEIN